MRFKNKVVIVTGSSRGIGKATALAFAREGAKVVITSRKQKDCDAAAKEIGSACLAAACDVSKAKDIDNLVKQTLKRFSRIDVVVNNAGILNIKSITDTTEKDWSETIDINLKGQFLLCKAVAQHLKSGAAIVNISSVLGETGAEDVSAYCASKGGVIALTKALAIEFAPKNIRVNAIAPGPIRTAMLAPIEQDPQLKKEVLNWVPLHRFGEPEEVAKAVLFLASDDASYITGHVLNVDGGTLAW
jgi:3-oxoacyl-[acyl-carrier protein] reductase